MNRQSPVLHLTWNSAVITPSVAPPSSIPALDFSTIAGRLALACWSDRFLAPHLPATEQERRFSFDAARVLLFRLIEGSTHSELMGVSHVLHHLYSQSASGHPLIFVNGCLIADADKKNSDASPYEAADMNSNMILFIDKIRRMLPPAPHFPVLRLPLSVKSIIAVYQECINIKFQREDQLPDGPRNIIHSFMRNKIMGPSHKLKRCTARELPTSEWLSTVYKTPFPDKHILLSLEEVKRILWFHAIRKHVTQCLLSQLVTTFCYPSDVVIALPPSLHRLLLKRRRLKVEYTRCMLSLLSDQIPFGTSKLKSLKKGSECLEMPRLIKTTSISDWGDQIPRKVARDEITRISGFRPQ